MDIIKIIKNQQGMLGYSKSTLIPLKECIYQSFINLLVRVPDQMTDYLLNGKRGLDIQSKIFQEYVSVLESKIPFSFYRGKSIVSVKSILDPQISPFSGLSTFDAIVDNNGVIKNNTKEMYVGSKSGYYCQPYYIGKIINVSKDGVSLNSKIIEYSFSKIKTNIEPNTAVTVSHLRIPAHYQVGALSHINRIKKEISKAIKMDLMIGQVNE